MHVPVPFLRAAGFALLAAAGLAFAPEARAHGGNFREGGADSPNVAAPLPGDTGRRKPTTVAPDPLTGDWQVWWMLNRESLLPDKPSVRSRAESAETSSPFFGLGDVDKRGLGEWEHRLRVGATDAALPFLLDLLAPGAKTEEALIGPALVALGRIARDPMAVPVLQRYATESRWTEEIRESAVLALGLLRRTRRSDQLDTETLTKVRSFLIRLFDDKDASTRLRAFAVVSVGLLADQPYPDTTVDRDGRLVTRALWQRLRRKYPSSELPVALLTALGRQPRAGVPSGVLEGLRAIAGGKPFQHRRWDGPRRSHAMTAYARLDGPAWLPLALWTMRGTHDHGAVRAASAIAIAQRAGDLDAEERLQAARSLRRSLGREPHWLVRGLGHIALAFLLREDLRTGSPALLEELELGRFLCRETSEGRSLTRPYSALAVGLSVHGVEPATKPAAVYLKEARATLERGLRRGRGSDRVLGAWAVGLGLAGARSALEPLLEILTDRKRGPTLRGHCAVALAHIGLRTPDVLAALRGAAEERIAPTVHVQAVRALALLAPPGTTDRLLRQLETTTARHAVAVVAGAVGSFGDPSATPKLIALAKSDDTPLVVRTMCVVALGLIFDPEPRPSRVHLTTHANYPSRTASLSQAFNIM